MNMEFSKLGSGDNQNTVQLGAVSQSNDESTKDLSKQLTDDVENADTQLLKELKDDLSPEICDEYENNLKARIAQCRNVIETLKQELNEEKCKVEYVSKSPQSYSDHDSKYTVDSEHTFSGDGLLEDTTFSSNVYSAYVDSKLNCDENLVKYEKTVAEISEHFKHGATGKENAIRKQMLCKAYRLKLLEVENQCNIELLRVKQSLQCLEPLKMIAQNWTSNTDDIIDNTSFNLLPRYPDFYSKCTSDFDSITGELDANNNTEKPEKCVKNDIKSSDT